MVVVNKKIIFIAELSWDPNRTCYTPVHHHFITTSTSLLYALLHTAKGTLPPPLALNVDTGSKLWALYNMDVIVRDTGLFFVFVFFSYPSWYLCSVQEWHTTWERGKERASTKTGRGELWTPVIDFTTSQWVWTVSSAFGGTFINVSYFLT